MATVVCHGVFVHKEAIVSRHYWPLSFSSRYSMCWIYQTVTCPYRLSFCPYIDIQSVYLCVIHTITLYDKHPAKHQWLSLWVSYLPVPWSACLKESFHLVKWLCMQCVCIEVEWQHSHSKHYVITSGFVFVASARKPAYSIGEKNWGWKCLSKYFTLSKEFSVILNCMAFWCQKPWTPK